MKWFIGVFLSIIFFSCVKNKEVSKVVYFRQSAEYELTKSIWMQWPNYTHKFNSPVEPLIISMIKEITPFASVQLMIARKDLEKEIREKFRTAKIDTNKITFQLIDYSEFWTRDMGPRFTINNKGEKKIVDFGFNTWSYLDEKDSLSVLDEKVDEKIAKRLKLSVLSSDLIVEGGDNEISREGILMLTESVQKKRNPHLSLKEIENKYRNMIGARSFIWFRKGLKDDDYTLNGAIKGLNGEPLFTCLTTNGHVDEYARFANDSTILFAKGNERAVHPVEKETNTRMGINEKILRNSTRLNGQPFNIIYLPLVPVIISNMNQEDGTYQVLQNSKFADSYPYGLQNRPEKMIAAASYLNFVIINELVLVPHYGIKEDNEAMIAFKKAFPNKKIVPLNPISLNWGGGGMHCITQNEPY